MSVVCVYRVGVVLAFLILSKILEIFVINGNYFGKDFLYFVLNVIFLKVENDFVESFLFKKKYL